MPGGIMRIGASRSNRTPAVVAGVAAVAAMLAGPRHGAAPSVRTVVVMAVPGAESAARTAIGVAGGRVTRSLSVIDGFIASVPDREMSAVSSSPAVRTVTPDQHLSVQSFYGQDSGVASAAYPDVVRAAKTWGSGDTGT